MHFCVFQVFWKQFVFLWIRIQRRTFRIQFQIKLFYFFNLSSSVTFCQGLKSKFLRIVQRNLQKRGKKIQKVEFKLMFKLCIPLKYRDLLGQCCLFCYWDNLFSTEETTWRPKFTSEQTWTCPLLCHTNTVLRIFNHLFLSVDKLFTLSKGPTWVSLETKHRSSNYPSESAYFRYVLIISIQFTKLFPVL